MTNKIILLILSVNLLLEAFPPNKPYFNNLLINNGKIKSTLKVKKTDDYNNTIYFDGEVTLTGVIERADHYTMGDIYSELRFYPDKNIDLPFLYYVYNKDYKEFERLDFGVFLYDKNINMPNPINKRFFGVSAVRAEITIKNYYFYGEGDAGMEAYGNIVSFKQLGDIKTVYFTKNYLCDYRKLEYNSKDDYINIRDKENGKILKKDMDNNEALLLYINGDGIDFVSLEDLKKMWLEVFYLPPNIKDGKDAIHGFVHGSQVKIGI